MPPLLGALSTFAVLTLVYPRRPTPARCLRAADGRRRPGPAARLGVEARRRGRIDASPLPDRALGALLVAAPLVGVAMPPLALLLVVAVWLQARLAARRHKQLSERELLRMLPDAVDLLLLCTGAGIALPQAQRLVAARVPAPIGPALDAGEALVAAGRPRADALLEVLSPLGERGSSLAHVLVDHLRYGVALAPGLERISLELRLDRRRRAEEEARRVPVRLLAPLVGCILPAFGLLTVVPLLAASLEALPR